MPNLPAHLRPWRFLAESAGVRYRVDPLLILALIDRESRGGLALRPQGPQGYGDSGHGHGLMQIDDRWHAPFLAVRLDDGSPAWADPMHNTDYGTSLLRAALNAFGEDEELAACAYNAGVGGVRRALSLLTAPSTLEAKRAAANAVTTGGDYGVDVLRRRDSFRPPQAKENVA